MVSRRKLLTSILAATIIPAVPVLAAEAPAVDEMLSTISLGRDLPISREEKIAEAFKLVTKMYIEQVRNWNAFDDDSHVNRHEDYYRDIWERFTYNQYSGMPTQDKIAAILERKSELERWMKDSQRWSDRERSVHMLEWLALTWAIEED